MMNMGHETGAGDNEKLSESRITPAGRAVCYTEKHVYVRNVTHAVTDIFSRRIFFSRMQKCGMRSIEDS